MITITPKALTAIKDKIAKRENKNTFLRLGVKGSGCSGLSYVIEFDDNGQTDKDIVMIFDAGVQVLIDNKSIKYLDDTTLDYRKSLTKEGFNIINPNEISRCGCGASFEVKR